MGTVTPSMAVRAGWRDPDKEPPGGWHHLTPAIAPEKDIFTMDGDEWLAYRAAQRAPQQAPQSPVERPRAVQSRSAAPEASTGLTGRSSGRPTRPSQSNERVAERMRRYRARQRAQKSPLPALPAGG